MTAPKKTITDKGKATIYFLENLCKFEDKPITLYPYQKEFLSDTSTYRIVNKARQLGFSWIIAAEAVFEVLAMPNHTVLMVSTGESGAKRVLDYCYKLFRGMKFSVNFTKATQEEIGLSNGSRIISLPNNPNTVRGFNAGRVYIDESAHFLKDREIFQAIQPSISRGGKITLISTPKGRANIFHEKWTDDDDYSHHRVPYTECPDPKYQKTVKKQRRTMYDMDFRQEYCCDFMADDMAMFPKSLIEPCVDSNLKNVFFSESQNPFFMGIDFAKKVDSTVVSIAETTKAKLIVIRHLKEMKRMPYETDDPTLPSQLLEITKLFKTFKIQRIKMDSTGVGVKLEEDLIRKFGSIVEGVRFGINEKEALITNLRIAFEKKCLRIPDNEELISQLMGLEKHTTETGLPRYKHVSGKHDDYVWSLALCVSAATLASIDIGFSYVGEAVSYKVNEKVFEKPSIIAF